MWGIGDHDETGGKRMSNDRLDLDIGFDAHSDGTTDDYYTPSYIFEALGLKFDIDVCAPPGGIPWIPAARSFSIIDDGLEQDWAGQLVWMNPPYSKPTPWMNKFIANGNGVALICTSKAAWFNTLWAAADGILSMDPKMKFSTPFGEPKGIFMPTFLFAIGHKNVEAMKQSGLGHVR